MRALNESNRQSQLHPQLRFARPHFAIVGFVIVAGQMQQPVEDQDLQLRFGGMPKFGGICGSNLSRDSQVASHLCPSGSQFEAQHIRRLIFMPVFAIQFAEFRAVGDPDVNRATQPHGAPSLPCEQGQRPLVDVIRFVS